MESRRSPPLNLGEGRNASTGSENRGLRGAVKKRFGLSRRQTRDREIEIEIESEFGNRSVIHVVDGELDGQNKEDGHQLEERLEVSSGR